MSAQSFSVLMKEYLSSLAVFSEKLGFVGPILFFLVYLIVIKFVFLVLRKTLSSMTSKTKTKVDDDLLKVLYNPSYVFAVALGVYVVLKAYITSEVYGSILNKSLFSFLVLIIGIIVYRIINVFVHEYGLEIAKKTESDIDDNLFPFMESLIKITTLIIVGLQILSIWDIKITPLLASAGIAGIAIALAAQETIKNLFGGVTLYIDKNLKVGDMVVIDGRKLKVLEVGVRSTKFITLDNTLLVIPNSHLSTTTIENLTAPYKKPKKVKVNFGVAYGSDVDKVKEIAIKTAKEHKEVDPNRVSVYFTDMKDFYLEFLLVMEVKDYSKVFTTKADIVERLYKELNKNKIEIPFPTYTVFLNKSD